VLNKLYEMLRDRDPQVVANCIAALNEILAREVPPRPLYLTLCSSIFSFPLSLMKICWFFFCYR
jgi:vesicle coat complex subunit